MKHTPNYNIVIQRVGGGASPEGFAAWIDPDEIWAQPLIETNGDAVEDWTEAECHKRAIMALIVNGDFGESPSLPRFFIARREWMFTPDLEAWQRAELSHDIADACLAIESGLAHSFKAE